MTLSVSAGGTSGQPSPDLLVVGGGVMGLWAALKAADAGLDVLLVERSRIGAGASGGLLGALMPHMPDRWNDKKQFQFDALVSLEAEIAALEARTGLSAGYRRTGRVIPLGRPHLRQIAERQAQDARTVWRQGEHAFRFEVTDAAPAEGWPAAGAADCGFVVEALSARLDPRRLLSALKVAIEQAGRVRIREGTAVVSLDPMARSASLADGTTITFGHAILSAGVESFDILARIGPPPARPIGVPVKGQAALLRADASPGLPIVFQGGLYVIAHDAGHVAVGSTSEPTFAVPGGTDEHLDAVIERAQRLVPLLKGAAVLERWSGLRPKAIGRDPMAGRHPLHSSFSVLTGGFKISFGVAHALAAAVVGEIANGSPPGLPQSFTVAAHLEAAR
ncbi:FAD-binding oxidoreductase [Rhizobium sp. TRM95111]|uniref:NAD(P)/FAD-dependent oxidoreductase n=1 Tax=Rhizobium alarense TaxID=2846851 RepID=UPI001F4036C1|nr:FAD-dependent oxidoreductase [Rhizobium alarense]MCF3638905.1 FAD-binding oxidoreductase [Rhizobium alarense]